MRDPYVRLFFSFPFFLTYLILSGFAELLYCFADLALSIAGKIAEEKP